MTNRVIVLGIDGATFDILDAWIQDGAMPNLARLLNDGTRATLRSTIPPYTPQAWVSMMTGKTPARHGVVDFVERGEDRVARGFASSTLIEGEAVWDTVSRHGGRVGVVNMPLTYPPREVNGYMVSGLLTPRDRQDYTFPLEIRDELLAVEPQYHPDPYEPLSLELDLANFLRWTEMGERAARHLWQSHPVDLFISVIQTVDYLQHIVWRALTNPSVRSKTPFNRLYSEVERCVAAVDAAIGERLRWMDEDSTLFLVSDHGFQAATSWFHVNHWLRELGWLQLQPSSGALSSSWAARLGWSTRDLKALVRRLDVLGLRRHLGRANMDRLANQVSTALNIPIDWNGTLAYAAPPTNEGICINLRGREPNGVVEPGAHYEEVRQQVMFHLAQLRDPNTNRTVVNGVHRREDVYSGQYLDLMPDILLEFEDRPYLVSDSTTASQSITPIGDGYVEGRHHPKGVFAAFGPHISAGLTLPELSIVDVAPTLLYALDLPVPANLDGQVVTQAFRAEYLAGHPIVYERSGPVLAGNRQGSSYDKEEEEDMRRKLQGLGYIT